MTLFNVPKRNEAAVRELLEEHGYAIEESASAVTDWNVTASDG